MLIFSRRTPWEGSGGLEGQLFFESRRGEDPDPCFQKYPIGKEGARARGPPDLGPWAQNLGPGPKFGPWGQIWALGPNLGPNLAPDPTRIKKNHAGALDIFLS